MEKTAYITAVNFVRIKNVKDIMEPVCMAVKKATSEVIATKVSHIFEFFQFSAESQSEDGLSVCLFNCVFVRLSIRFLFSFCRIYNYFTKQISVKLYIPYYHISVKETVQIYQNITTFLYMGGINIILKCFPYLKDFNKTFSNVYCLVHFSDPLLHGTHVNKKIIMVALVCSYSMSFR